MTSKDADTLDFFIDNVRRCLAWFWSLRAPILLLGAIAISPKFILLWIFIVLAKPITLWALKFVPASAKARFANALPSRVKNSTLFRDFNEGADQGLPFILFWLYICCAPFAIMWIAIHWTRELFFADEKPKAIDPDVFNFTQNKRQNVGHSENNFYYSKVFGVTLFAFFVLGIPAFMSFAVFEKLGIEKKLNENSTSTVFMQNQSNLPAVKIPNVGMATRLPKNFNPKMEPVKAPTGGDATFIMGYNGYWPWLRDFGVEPSKASVFFVHFYLISVASALCMLFFRAWFLFPLNFLSDEHDIEFTASGIKRNTMKGWFLSVLTINRWAIGGGPDSLRWNEVRSLRRFEEGYFKLHPLPETAFKKESLSYKLLNKLAALMDGISNRSNKGNFLVFSSTETGSDFGNHIKINLNDLNREQRARLFYSVKQWAPHVVIHSGVEEQLIGSTVLKDNRYTQLWFDILTTRSSARKRQNVLPPGDSLKSRAYTIKERITSGGQSTTYIATRENGEQCVLKEFILATDTESGALIESAREFEAEVSLLSQLDNPGIVKLQDFFAEDGRLYVALEYIQGQSLRQVVQLNGKLDEAKVAEIATSVCDVLEYLHKSNPPIVHRDITPENILIQPDGKIKLIDFSLAVRHDGRQTTDSCAKQAFTPPEQFREEFCTQSDIYALGATMHFLLTGLTPKPISSSSPQSKRPELSTEINSIVERATQLDLDKRYESVHWMKLDLANIEPLDASPPATPSPPVPVKTTGATIKIKPQTQPAKQTTIGVKRKADMWKRR